MQIAEILGLVGGALVTFSTIPQVIRVFKLRSAREISLLFTMLLWLGMVFWLAYGIYLDLIPIILWNAISLVLVALLIYAKLMFGR